MKLSTITVLAVVLLLAQDVTGACVRTVAAGSACGATAGCCPAGQCCSKHGYCGVTAAHCGDGCQQGLGTCGNVAPPAPPAKPLPQLPQGTESAAIAAIVSTQAWASMFQQPANCPGKRFYTRSAFLRAASFYPSFGTRGTLAQRRREVAAFLAQISAETFGAPLTGGLCWLREGDFGASGPTTVEYCDSGNTRFPCVAGRRYFGRGPMQLSWNYNYGQAGRALGLDLLGNPDWVAQDAVLAFRTALWFWMTPQAPKPSCHDVMLGRYVRTQQDINARREHGLGWTTLIINGGIECNLKRVLQPQQNRIDYFRSYCAKLGVEVGTARLDCANQQSY